MGDGGPTRARRLIVRHDNLPRYGLSVSRSTYGQLFEMPRRGEPHDDDRYRPSSAGERSDLTLALLAARKAPEPARGLRAVS